MLLDFMMERIVHRKLDLEEVTHQENEKTMFSLLYFFVSHR